MTKKYISKLAVVSIVLVLISVVCLSACSQKKRCAICGRTEDEAELSQYNNPKTPEVDGNYYCSVHMREIVSRYSFSTEAASEIAEVLGTEESEEIITSEETFEEAVEDSVEETLYQPLTDFIFANVGATGTEIYTPVECDITGDGELDLVAMVATGSGITNTLIVVYDVQNNMGYILDDRMEYDYQILGNSDNDIAILRIEYGGSEDTYGTLAIQGGQLVFVENEEYGATV